MKLKLELEKFDGGKYHEPAQVICDVAKLFRMEKHKTFSPAASTQARKTRDEMRNKHRIFFCKSSHFNIQRDALQNAFDELDPICINFATRLW